MQLLQASTAATVRFGPFVDPTDGVTLKIALVSALDNGSTGIVLSKNGGPLAVRHTVTASVYDSFGFYNCSLDTTDTGTMGRLLMAFTGNSTALPIWREFMVVPANLYAAWTGTTTFQKVDIAAINTQTGDAPLLQSQVEVGFNCTVNTSNTASTGTSFSCSDVLTATAGFYVGKQCWQWTGAGQKQWWGVCTAYSLIAGEGNFTLSPGSPTGTAPVTGNFFFFL